MSDSQPVWEPTLQRKNAALISEFQQKHGFSSFAEFHQWSVDHKTEFWSEAWDFCDLRGHQGTTKFVPDIDPILCQFFPEARLNVVETFLKNADHRDAIVFEGEDGRRLVWTRADLKREVEKLTSALSSIGVAKGDRVVGYVPNMPQTVAAMLATASLGAVWSSCAPESGPGVVVDRFGQIAPKVMFAADGYFYGGKAFETRDAIAEVAHRVPSIELVVVWSYAGDATHLPNGMMPYEAFKAHDAAELTCETMRFRDPLYVMFSSGTTGKPKCIEHSGGGTLLRLLVEHQLHCDVKPGDRLFYYTTCNWMMWNWQVAALASEATIVLFDGNPMHPGMSRLFDLAQSERLTHLGVSAKYIDASLKRRSRPIETHDLSDLRVVLSTGSPLSPDGYDHVYSDWKSDVQLASICGGTDILGAFVGGCPTLSIYKGEIPCATLGLDVATLDENGTSISGVAGELVCRNAHPSMPTRFLNDPDHARYRASYFDTYPNIWRQGDFTIRTQNGGFVVLGRSDATLNPGGVRIGTAEIYRQLDKIEEISEAVVVGKNTDNDVQVVLFVMLEDDQPLDDVLITRIKSDIRKNASPRHVPAKIIAVLDIPRTKSGKIAELAVRDVVNNQPVRNLSGLANPQALDFFTNHPKLTDQKGLPSCHLP